jgi:DoxX-like family
MVADAVVSSVLAALLVLAAARKLSHRPAVVASYRRVGVPEHRLNALAQVLLAGTAGLIAGLWWRPVGIAAASGLVCYFLLAVGAHIRAGDARNLPSPLVYLALASAALVLHLG